MHTGQRWTNESLRRKPAMTADCQPLRNGGHQNSEQGRISQPKPHQHKNQQRIDEVN